MTLEQAITILTDLLGEGPQFSPDLRRQAVNQGIEALKFRQRWEQQEGDNDYARLQAETNE